MEIGKWETVQVQSIWSKGSNPCNTNVLTRLIESVKRALYELTISSSRRYLTAENTIKVLVSSCVFSILDYCSSFLMGILCAIIGNPATHQSVSGERGGGGGINKLTCKSQYQFTC